jgi:hypothetical protein
LSGAHERLKSVEPKISTSVAPQGEDLETGERVTLGAGELAGGFDGGEEYGAVMRPSSVSTDGARIIHRPLPLRTYRFSESRKDGVAEKVGTVGWFVGHVLASAVLVEAFRFARRRASSRS